MDTQNLVLPQITTDTLNKLGYSTLTPVQSEVLQAWRAKTDIVALAATGSGKTMAFALSTLPLIALDVYQPQVIVLCPTRELAMQVAQEFRRAVSLLDNIQVVSLIGGEPVGAQIKALRGASQIVVGTPGRVKDHVDKRRLDLSAAHTRILDEADRMLEMGMVEDVEAIFAATPSQSRTGFFSATFPDEVMQLANRWLNSPKHIDAREQAIADIDQQWLSVDAKNKRNAITALLSEKRPQKAIVFCQTKQGTDNLFQFLVEKQFAAVAIQGDMEQYERLRALTKFSLGAANVLVGTDVAARGLDLPEVDLVVSYDLSESVDTHTHRIGRTGRAGNKGEAVAFVTPEQKSKVQDYVKPDERVSLGGVQHLRFHQNRIVQPEWVCIEIKGGKKDKLRKGDIVGALTKESEVPGDDIGDIVLQSKVTFVAIKARSVKKTLRHFREGKIKGRRYMAVKL